MNNMSVIIFASVLIHVRLAMSIIMNEDEVKMKYTNKTEETFGDSVTKCLSTADYKSSDIITLGSSLSACIKRGATNSLMNNLEVDCIDVGDGVTFTKDHQGDDLSPRDLFPLDHEPNDHRGVLDAYSMFLSRRALRWDLGHLYPGLVMKIGPTLSGEGILEFAVEKRLGYIDRAQLRPTQQVIRQTILPRLLGFRMNLLSLLPLMFGALVYISKNAFIFSKVTLIVSALLALKSVLLVSWINSQQQHHSHHTQILNDHGPIDTGGLRPLAHQGGYFLNPHHEDTLLQMITSGLPPFKGVNDKDIKITSNRITRNSGARNFAWERS